MPSLSASVDKPICVPSEIPTDWVWQELVKCCRPRQWPTISKEQLLDEGFPVYGANGLIGYYSEYNHENPTIAVTCRGATCGTLNYVPAQSYITGNAMCLDELDLEKVSESYLYYALLHRGLFDVITGSAQPQITAQSLKKVTFPCPPLSEQKKIAEILESVDDAITKTESVIAQTQRVKQGLLQQLLTRGISHTKFKQTPLGEIPESWEVVKIGDISSRVTSGSRGWASYYADEGAAFIRITNLKRSSIYPDFSDLQHVQLPAGSAEGVRTKVVEGDILISITADLGIIGYIKSLDDIGEAYVNQHIALVSLDLRKVHSGFVAYFLSSPLMQRHISKLNDAGAKAGLNLPTIRNLPVLLPDYDEQKAIYKILETLDENIRDGYTALNEYKCFKKGLMSDLLTGRVRVKTNDKALNKIEAAA